MRKYFTRTRNILEIRGKLSKIVWEKFVAHKTQFLLWSYHSCANIEGGDFLWHDLIFFISSCWYICSVVQLRICIFLEFRTCKLTFYAWLTKFGRQLWTLVTAWARSNKHLSHQYYTLYNVHLVRFACQWILFSKGVFKS